MQVIILGAGIIGVTSAYYLAKAGFKVTIIDRNAQVALESSYSNGSQLCYSCVNPPNSKKSPTTLPTHLRVFRNSLFTAARKEFQNLIAENNLIFDYQLNGVLQLFFKKEQLDDAVNKYRFKSSLGIPYQVLTKNQAFEKEPLISNANDLEGAIFIPNDGTGDALEFTKLMAKKCSELGVKFIFNENIEQIEVVDNQIQQIITTSNSYKSDIYLSALGAYGSALLKSIGIKLNISPKKGYSITFEIDESDKVPLIGIGDQTNEVYYSKLGNRLRVAGLTETCGFNDELTKSQIDLIINLTDQLFPNLKVKTKESIKRACFRPFPANSVPSIGQTIIENLYINTGHGGFGWTLAPISGKIIKDIIVKVLY
jgi:D-amino-acid dehydrogenase